MVYQLIYIFFHLPTYSSFLYLLRNLVEKWSRLFHHFISIFYLSIFLVYFKLLGIVLWSYHLEKALHDSFCRHFIYCCDWIRLHWLGPECGVFWMALYSNGQHRTALGCTSLDSAGVHCARHCAPDWNTLHCTSVGGTGLDWTGLDWTEQDSTSRNWIVVVVFYGLGVFRMEIHCNVLAWMGLDWSERDKTVLDQRALHFAALNCYRLYRLTA